MAIRAPAQSAADSSIPGRLRSLADPGLGIVLLVVTLAAWPLLTRASLPTFTDAHHHIYRVYEILAAWRQGLLYPRWAPDFYYGYGYPVFDYYSTLAYDLAAAYGWFFGPVAGIKFAFVLTTYLGAAGVYLLAREQWGPATGVVSAAVFACAPYIAVSEPIQRGGLPEGLAIALAPWVLWSFTRLAHTGTRAFWRLSALLLAALIAAHNLMSFVFIGLLGAWLAWQLLVIQRPRSRAEWVNALARLATAALAAAALSAYMWLPALAERGAVQFQNAFSLAQANRFLAFGQLFAPFTTHDVQSFYAGDFHFRLGWPPWLLGLLGALTLLRPTPLGWTPGRRAALLWLLVTLPCLFLMDPLSTWVWDHVSALPYLQFSYRLLAVTALSLAMLAGAAVNGLSTPRLPISRAGWAVILTALTLAASLPLFNPLPWPDFGPVDRPAILNLDLFGAWGVGTTLEGEFLPVGVRAKPQPAPAVVAAIQAGGYEKVDRAALPTGATVTETAHDAVRDVFQISAPVSFTLRLFTFYWPGWTAYLDGVPTLITVTTPEGFIAVALPAGAHALTVQLEDTGPRRLGWALSGAGLVLVLVLGVGGGPGPTDARRARLRRPLASRPHRAACAGGPGTAVHTL